MGCHIHGSTTEIAIQFWSSESHQGLRHQPSIRRLLVPIGEKHMLPNIMPVTLVDVLYAMYIEITGEFDTQQR